MIFRLAFAGQRSYKMGLLLLDGRSRGFQPLQATCWETRCKSWLGTQKHSLKDYEVENTYKHVIYYIPV